jgi:hypothetical protein
MIQKFKKFFETKYRFASHSEIPDEVFQTIKDICTDFADIDIISDVFKCEYHRNVISGRDAQILKAISIELKDASSRFFTLKEILPVIETIESHISEWNLNIDIELISENEFFTLSEFKQEFMDEEFYTLGIIIF